MNETLRVNGRASMTTGPSLLIQLWAQGKRPEAACYEAIDEVFLHFAKALVHSKLWDSDRHMDRTEFPPLGSMIAEQIGTGDRDGPGFTEKRPLLADAQLTRHSSGAAEFSL